MPSENGGSSLALFKDREFIAITGTAFARSQAYSTILIALALYADLFSTTGTIEGLFGTTFALIQLVIVLPLGRAIDTKDAKKFLLAGLLINIAVFVGFMFVQNAVHVILIRIVQGLGASILWITGSTIVGEISPDGARGRWLGTYNQVAAFSSLAGDLIGGYLLYAHGFKLTYILLSGVTLTAVVLAYLFLRDNPGGRKDPEEATSIETFRSLLGLPAIRALTAFRLSFSFGKMAVVIFLPIFARKEFGISALAIGGILAGGKLTKSLLQGKMGDITDQLGHRHYFVFTGALLYALGTIAIPFASTAEQLFPVITLGALGRSVTISGAFVSLFFAYSILGVADSFRLPASMALYVEEGERYDAVASSMSLRSIAWKLGQITGPLAVGAIKDAVSIAYGFWTAGGVVVISAGIFMVLYTRGQQAEAPLPASGD
ncbi:MAG: MFS transporter [Halobacteriales archaeon]|nr:MFS transporter [Halobacteriales archaeon]